MAEFDAMKRKSRQLPRWSFLLAIVLALIDGQDPVISLAQLQADEDAPESGEVFVSDFDSESSQATSNATVGSDSTNLRTQGGPNAAEVGFGIPVVKDMVASSGKVTFARGNNLSLTVDTRWASYGGETPVRLHFALANPATRDRVFHVVFRVSDYSQLGDRGP